MTAGKTGHGTKENEILCRVFYGKHRLHFDQPRRWTRVIHLCWVSFLAKCFSNRVFLLFSQCCFFANSSIYRALLLSWQSFSFRLWKYVLSTENAFGAQAHWCPLFKNFKMTFWNSKKLLKKYLHLGNDVYYKNTKSQS
jgi:hypothetical protein